MSLKIPKSKSKKTKATVSSAQVYTPEDVPLGSSRDLVSLDAIDAVAAEKFIQSIPETLRGVLDMSRPALVVSAARLHALMAHWSARFAHAKGRHTAAVLARRTTRNHLKAQVREMSRAKLIPSLTESGITEKAECHTEYLDMCRHEVEAEVEMLKLKGLVDAIVTKREALRLISYYVRPEMLMASQATVGDDTQATENVEVQDLLAEARDLMDLKVWE